MQCCITCNVPKPFDEFYRHPRMASGYLSKCKECQKQASRATRLARLDYYQEYDRQRGKLPHRIQLKKTVLANRPAVKREANYATSNAIRDGRLVKQPCEVCGTSKVEAHHDDYTQPLQVRWLCRKHHMQWHYELPLPF